MKLSKLKNSFKYALKGIKSSFTTEQNMRIHITIMAIIIIFGLIFKISTFEWITCIILFSIVIAGELINTAIETVVDLVKPEIHPKAGLAKDIAAGAVLILAIGSILGGLIIFLPKIINIFI